MTTFILFLAALLAAAFTGGYFEIKLKTKNGLNVTYTDKTGAVKNLF